MRASPITAGWCRVRMTDASTAVLWVEPHPLPGSASAWVIAGRTRDAAGTIATCAFVMRQDEFERDALVERIIVEPPSCPV